MESDLRKIFAKQLRSEIKFENAEHVRATGAKTYFGRTLSLNDKLLFAFIIERISGTQIHGAISLFTERDFPDLSKKFTLDEALTQKQFESNKHSAAMPVFVKDKILNEYMLLKGLKNGRK